MKKILISGYYGYSNSGDDAILSSICHDLQQLSKDNDITILSNSPEATKIEYGFHSIHRFKMLNVIKAMKHTDVLLMGGGTLIQDNTSSRSLYYYLGLIWLAKRMGKKCVLYGNGIGPVKKRFNRWLTRLIVNQVDLITLREHLSKRELKRLGVLKPEIHVTADPVFNLVYEKIDGDTILEKEGVDQSKPLVSVFFRSWQHEEQYVKKIAKVCDYIHDTYDMNILLIPMKYPDDVGVSEEIMEGMNNKAYILKHKYDVPTLIALIQGTRLVLSMRLHAIIYGAIKSIPTIGFEYDPKVKYFIEELDMSLAGKMDDFTVEKVIGQVDYILNNYDAITQKLNKKVEKIKADAGHNIQLFNKL